MRSAAATSRRLSWQELLLVLFSQGAMAVESQKPSVRITFLAVMLATLLIQIVPWRISLSLDRARMFATVGIVGYVFYGLPRLRGIFSGTLPQGAEELDRFFTGLVLLFTVHQLGAFLRLGAGGTVAPVLIGSGVHIIGATSAQASSRSAPWLVAGWAILGILALRRAYAPPSLLRSRRLWTRTTALALSILVTTSLGLSVGLPVLQRMMESSTWQLGGRSRGSNFRSEASELGIVQSMKLSDRPVMRIEGRELIGMHLRAAVYARWQKEKGISSWRLPPAWYLDIRQPGNRIPLESFDAERGYGVGPLPEREDWGSPDRELHIRLDPGFSGTQRPTPLGTSMLLVRTTADSELYAPVAGIVQVRAMGVEEVARRYGVVYQREPRGAGARGTPAGQHDITEPDGENECLGGTSAAIPPRITALAREITAGIETPFERALALERWFADSGRFTYSLDVPEGQDLEAFLFEPGRQLGWCEYYASAMTVMLRAIDIPSRYVAGYLATEYNPVGGYVIVRERDAHAWVEAFFPDQGWRTFDPTPPSFRDVGSDPTTGWLGGLLDAVREHMRWIVAAFAGGGAVAGMRAILEFALTVLLGIVTNPVVLALAALALAFRIMRALLRRARERTRRRREEEASGPPAVRALRRRWQEVLQQARERGVSVSPGDTPRRVLGRLTEAGTTGALDPRRIGPLVELIYCTRYAGRPLEEEAVAAVLAGAPPPESTQD